MSDVKMFRLPDVGEGLTEAEIVSWKVKVGDTVKVNDIIVEIETAKSLVELPCPYAGTVNELYAAQGDTVDVGSPIIAVGTGTGGGSAPEPSARADPSAPEVGSAAEDLVPAPKGDEAVEPGLIGGPAPGGRTSVLVGYGPRTTEAKRRPRKGGTPEGVSPAAAQVGVNHAFTPDATPTPDVSIEEAVPAGVPSGSVQAVGSAGAVSSSTATATDTDTAPAGRIRSETSVTDEPGPTRTAVVTAPSTPRPPLTVPPPARGVSARTAPRSRCRRAAAARSPAHRPASAAGTSGMPRRFGGRAGTGPSGSGRRSRRPRRVRGAPLGRRCP